MAKFPVQVIISRDGLTVRVRPAAQATRTWVSGVGENKPVAAHAPCKT